MGFSQSFRRRRDPELRRRWPSIAKLLTEERVAAPDTPEEHSAWSFSHNVYWERQGGEDLVDEYELLLELGYRTNALNLDRRTRLLVVDEDQSVGAWAELRVGHWFDAMGFKIEQWDPPARRNRSGDILVSKGGVRMFVEVKAFRGDQSYQDRGDAGDVVARDVSTWLSGYPNLTFGLVVTDADSRGESYNQRTAKRDIERCARRVKDSGNPEIVTVLMGASIAAVEIQPGGDLVDTSVGHVGFLGTDHVLRNLLNHIQQPRDPIPAIAVIYDAEHHLITDFSIGFNTTAEVCYGSSVVDETGHMKRRYRRRNGLWNRSNSSSLDAVFVMGDREPERSIWGYLAQSDEAQEVKAVIGNSADRWVAPNDWQN